jgi:hypothetical protein
VAHRDLLEVATTGVSKRWMIGAAALLVGDGALFHCVY